MSAMSAAIKSRAVRTVVGRGALADPRQALLGAATILALALAGLLALTRPWEGSPPASGGASAPTPTQIAERSIRHAWGPGGTQLNLIWATPAYLRVTHQSAQAARFDPAKNLVFFMMEHKHTGNLGPVPTPVLRVGGMDQRAQQTVTTLDSSHHRFTVFVYPKMPSGGGHAAHMAALAAGSPIELVLPRPQPNLPPSKVSWPAGQAALGAGSAGGVRFTWATLLALFGGLLSSMWPCLFQLTVYFVPTLAGISGAQVKAGGDRRVQAQVIKTAATFVLGFVIVYTAAGAAAGAASKSLGGTSIFWEIRRPLSIAAGIVILVMALRLAANRRALLVCKMPIGNFLGRRRFGPLGTMLLGVAFAIGCTTCFGAAVVLAMVTYVGMAASPLSGALIMLVFSLGMAIPLMLGAVAMARVMNALDRMEKVAPYMILGASVVMAGFAVLLLTGHYMGLSNLVAQSAA